MGCNTMKLSAQLYPLYPEETREVRLEIKKEGQWQEIASKKVNDIGWSALFRIENWDSTNAVHIAGDQHLPTVLQHGIDEFGDGPWAILKTAALQSCSSELFPDSSRVE